MVVNVGRQLGYCVEKCWRLPGSLVMVDNEMQHIILQCTVQIIGLQCSG
jgi:hypothetical protein